MTEIINDTLPTTVSPEAQAAVRDRIVQYLTKTLGELDSRPGSVAGDLIVSPIALPIAAAEAGIDAVLGDLDLQNIINGIVNDCDFVNEYLKNLGVTDRMNASSGGQIRLLLDRSAVDEYFYENPGKTLDIPLGLQFLFDNQSVFHIRANDAQTSFPVYPPGSVTTIPHAKVLTLLDDQTYYVDYPVIGSMATSVAAGSSASVDQTVVGLVEALAVYDFYAGNPDMTLAEKAKMARSTFYAASMSTRGGAAGFVLRNFPDVVDASPVVSGDQEMIRDQTNVLGFSDGRLDMYTVSKTGLLIETFQLELPLVEDSGKVRFIGPVNFPNVPVLVDSVSPVGDADQELWNPDGSGTALLSRTLDPSKGIYGGVTRSLFEGFTMAIDMTYDGSDYAIPVRSREGVAYGLFDVTYRYEPSVASISPTVSSKDYAPVNVDVLSRACFPVVISNLTVQYYRRPSTAINSAQARAEILTSINRVAYPEQFSLAAINDAMLYAGAQGVRGIEAQARVSMSPATHFIDPDTDAPTTNAELDDVLADHVRAVPFPSLTDNVLLTFGTDGGIEALSTDPAIIKNPDTLNLTTTDPFRYIAIGPRNRGYILDSANLVLQEVRV